MTDISGYRAVWLLVMFDLPVDDADARKRYTKFRTELLKDGFLMLQFSVYGRFCPSEEASDVHRKKVRRAVPEFGEVRIIHVTDRQFAKMEVLRGKRPAPPEEAPPLLLLM
ncbi:MAG: CRISPR-associated endonuclease Cas2 [Holophagaceae bacterium]|nr:CRISPR-associated endonuclease Cas2 [Holophagaceae bacterium]